jgi:hypothetical protein
MHCWKHSDKFIAPRRRRQTSPGPLPDAGGSPPQSAGSPCLARARSQASSPIPSAAYGAKSRHGDGLPAWIEQLTRTPISPRSATQRGGASSVPRIRRRFAVSGSVRASGTPPDSTSTHSDG